jgi:hypothetical protein
MNKLDMVAEKAFDWQGQMPFFQRVRQNFDRPRVADIPAAVCQAVDSLGDLAPRLKGKRVAITAGSRGISDFALILSALVAHLRALGAEPFIVPAMGSHAGATAEGQRGMLAELGITEATTGAPVISSMETVELGRLSNGMPVYMDRHAASADAVILANRVKPHTDFSGPVESGLAKISVIGLGKLQGADTLHRYGVKGLRELLPQAARLVCQRAPVIFGLATVENAYHEVAQISAVPPEGIAGPQEQDLLQLAYQLMPRFPFPEIDVLIIEEMGKNISGVGLDPKVVGRVKVHGVPDLALSEIRTIAVLRLTQASHGNAAGIGLADVTTQKLFRQIDFEATYLNCITSGITGIQRAALPLVAPTEKAAIETALRSCGRPDIQNARVVRIKNTLSLGDMDVSVGLLPEVLPGCSITPVGKAFALPFDEQGNLLSF